MVDTKKMRDNGECAETEFPVDDLIEAGAFNLKTAVEPLLVLHPLESTNTCSRWGFHQFGALRSSR